MNLAIPQEWQDVLKQVQEVFPSAIIAGGALRDLANGKPIKDVDIFIPVHEDYVGNLQSAYEAIWDAFPGENIYVDQASHYDTIKDDADRDLHAIFKLNRSLQDDDIFPTIIAFDLILCKPEAAKIETFDINICQITYDGKVVKFTGAYATGILTRTIKVMNVNRTDRNRRRVERMQDKYTDFTVEEDNAEVRS